MADSPFHNRLEKKFLHLKKWAAREKITAFRVYDEDIPQYPYAVDFYAGSVVLYRYDRMPRGALGNLTFETAEQDKFAEVLAALKDVFQVNDNEIFLKTRKPQKGLSQYEKLADQDRKKIISEGCMLFWVNLSRYLDTGLFLDHRNTRKFVSDHALHKRCLNLFAYTGSVSVAAALGKAKEVVTVDMSNTYLAWAKENFVLNRIPLDQHSFVRADILDWLPAFSRSGSRFDFIFIDPPTFSNSKKMLREFDLQRDYKTLLDHCEKMLAPHGTLFFSNNFRSFQFEDLYFAERFSIENMTKKTLPEDFKNKKIHSSWLFRKKEV